MYDKLVMWKFWSNSLKKEIPTSTRINEDTAQYKLPKIYENAIEGSVFFIDLTGDENGVN